MPKLRDMIEGSPHAKALVKIARSEHEQPLKNRDDYEQRLKDIVQFCISPKRSSQIVEQFGYAPNGAFAALSRLRKEGKLTKVKNTYHAVITRELTDPEKVELKIPTATDKYLDQLEADAREFVWNYAGADTQLIKNFIKYTRDNRHGIN